MDFTYVFEKIHLLNMNSVLHQAMWSKTHQGSKATIIEKVKFSLFHPVHSSNIALLNKHSGKELRNPLNNRVMEPLNNPVMMELYDAIDSCPFTSCNDTIKTRFMIASSILPINPLTVSHNRRDGENQNIL